MVRCLLIAIGVKDRFGDSGAPWESEATPIVTDAKTPFVFGQANVIRFRREAPLSGSF
jgi:hypothetical protein